MKLRIERSRKQKTEFSKKLLYVIFLVSGIIIAFTLAIVWKTEDTTPLSYLIPAIFTEVAAATSFYFWKAKAENQIKLQKIYGHNQGFKEDDENELETKISEP